MIRENTAIIGGGLWEDMCGILDLPTRTSPVAFEGALARAMKNSELQYQRIAELEAENKRLREALEAVDGLAARDKGQTYHVMFRDDGSISLYYTRQDMPGHFVFYDTLDTGRGS